MIERSEDSQLRVTETLGAESARITSRLSDAGLMIVDIATYTELLRRSEKYQRLADLVEGAD